MEDLLNANEIDYNNSILELRNSDYIFISNASPQLVPGNIVTWGCNLIYIPYGLSISNADYSMQLQYNLELHQKAWRIFTLNNYYKGMFEKYNNRGGHHVINFGYSKFDEFALRTRKDTAPQYKDSKVFLWNIHYNQSPQSGFFSTWKTLGKKILKELSTTDGIVVVIRPHPFFFSLLPNKQEATWIKSFIDKYDHLILDESDDYIDAFMLSDALITDASSLLVEYVPMQKPICFTTVNGTRYLNDFATLIAEECTTIASQLEKVRQFIAQVKDPRAHDDLVQSQRELCEGGVFGTLDGSVGEQIIEHILEDHYA
jgi:CDP-glycerol glycerophosphotransferase (TagB/SpsB family)